jgi:L-arabinose isomerase
MLLLQTMHEVHQREEDKLGAQFKFGSWVEIWGFFGYKNNL